MLCDHVNGTWGGNSIYQRFEELAGKGKILRRI